MKTTRFALALFLLPAAMQGQIKAVSWASAGASASVIGEAGTVAYSVNASGTIGPFATTWNDINASYSPGNPGLISEGKIDDAGHTIGSYQTSSPPAQNSFFTSGGSTVTLGNLGGNGPLGVPYTTIGDINNSDYICGQSMAANGKQHAFLRDPDGTMHDLGTLEGASGTSWAAAINSANWIAGTSTHSDGTLHAVVWDASRSMTDLGPGKATGINNSNQVVGFAFPDGAFSWTSGGGLTLLTVPSGASATFAYGINDSGAISGAAMF